MVEKDVRRTVLANLYPQDTMETHMYKKQMKDKSVEEIFDDLCAFAIRTDKAA